MSGPIMQVPCAHSKFVYSPHVQSPLMWHTCVTSQHQLQTKSGLQGSAHTHQQSLCACLGLSCPLRLLCMQEPAPTQQQPQMQKAVQPVRPVSAAARALQELNSAPLPGCLSAVLSLGSRCRQVTMPLHKICSAMVCICHSTHNTFVALLTIL